MHIGEAWTTLGFNFREIIARLLNTPKNLRVEAAVKELEEARKIDKKLLVMNHPDQGGDPEKFKRISSALQSIEINTSEFAKKMAEYKLEEDDKVRIVFDK